MSLQDCKKRRGDAENSNHVNVFHTLPLDIVAIIFEFLPNFALQLHSVSALYSLPVLSDHIFRREEQGNLVSAFVWHKKVLFPQEITNPSTFEVKQTFAERSFHTTLWLFSSSFGWGTDSTESFKLESDIFTNLWNSYHWHLLLRSSLKRFVVDTTMTDTEQPSLSILNRFLDMVARRDRKRRTEFCILYNNSHVLEIVKRILQHQTFSSNFIFLLTLVHQYEGVSLVEPLRKLEECQSALGDSNVFTRLDIDLQKVHFTASKEKYLHSVDFVKIYERIDDTEEDEIVQYEALHLPNCSILLVPNAQYLLACNFDQVPLFVVLETGPRIDFVLRAILFCLSHEIQHLFIYNCTMRSFMANEDWDISVMMHWSRDIRISRCIF